jgi:hypothetical protein
MLNSRHDTLKVNGEITATLDLGDGKGERPITFTLHGLTLGFATSSRQSDAFKGYTAEMAKRP